MELNQINEEVAKIMQQARESAAAKMTSAQMPTMPMVPPAAPPEQAAGVKSFDATEIAELSSIREAYEQITVGLGQLEMQKREVIKNEKRINEKLTAIEAQEKVFLDKIVAKYGEGTFDINTGVFTPKT